MLGDTQGGLDARYLLSKIHPTTYNPRSLTTVSTPHRGSEFMTWCRANIGIGTDFDRTSEHAARLLHEDSSVPYSLKAPILSRAQVQAARDAADAAKQAKAAADKVKAANFPGLPYSLSTSLSGYLLDLLDSPRPSCATSSTRRRRIAPTSATTASPPARKRSAFGTRSGFPRLSSTAPRPPAQRTGSSPNPGGAATTAS